MDTTSAHPPAERTLRMVCIVPFLDEESHLGRFLESIVTQRRRPDRLVLVDDGCSDGSPRLANEFVQRHPWVQLLRRPPRPPRSDRLVDAPELVAFQWGLTQVPDEWDVAVKMDADLVLSSDVFSTLERAFLQRRDLGVAGTYLSVLDPASGELERERCPPHHVRGATKFYRRACYEQIAPISPMLGWDTIDEVAARQRGWSTESIACPSGDTVHLRPTGGEDGRLRAQFRWGTCAYGIGQHPLWVTSSVLRRLRERPRLLASAAFLAGWLTAPLRRVPRASAELRAFGRREQLDTLRTLLRRPSAIQRAIRFGSEPAGGR